MFLLKILVFFLMKREILAIYCGCTMRNFRWEAVKPDLDLAVSITNINKTVTPECIECLFEIGEDPEVKTLWIYFGEKGGTEECSTTQIFYKTNKLDDFLEGTKEFKVPCEKKIFTLKFAELNASKISNNNRQIKNKQKLDVWKAQKEQEYQIAIKARTEEEKKRIAAIKNGPSIQELNKKADERKQATQEKKVEKASAYVKTGHYLI